MAALYKRIACQNTEPLSKGTLLAYLPPNSVQYNLLYNLSDSQWKILSFDPVTKEACVIIYNDDVESANITLSFKLIPPVFS